MSKVTQSIRSVIGSNFTSCNSPIRSRFKTEMKLLKVFPGHTLQNLRHFVSRLKLFSSYSYHLKRRVRCLPRTSKSNGTTGYRTFYFFRYPMHVFTRVTRSNVRAKIQGRISLEFLPFLRFLCNALITYQKCKRKLRR